MTSRCPHHHMRCVGYPLRKYLCKLYRGIFLLRDIQLFQQTVRLVVIVPYLTSIHNSIAVMHAFIYVSLLTRHPTYPYYIDTWATILLWTILFAGRMLTIN